MSAKGIEIWQTGQPIVFDGTAITSAGVPVTSGSALTLYELQDDGTFKTFDFATNTFSSSAVSLFSVSMNQQAGNGGAVNTGYVSYVLSTVTGFTVGRRYIYEVTNASASPVIQAYKRQYGSAESDMQLSADGSGTASLNANVTKILGTGITETTTGNLAGGFKKFFDVASGSLAFTVASKNQTGDNYAYLGTNLGSLGANATALAPSATALSTAVWTPTKAGFIDVAISSRSTLVAGAQMDLINAPNPTAVTAIQNGLSKPATAQTITAPATMATLANQTSILSAVSGITTNTARSAPRVPDFLARPNAGSVAYTGDLYLYTLQGNLEDADANTVTVHARNAAGTSLDAGLTSTTMTRVSTGFYRLTYTVNSTDAAQAVYFDFSWTISATAMRDGAATEVQDAENYSVLAAIKAKSDLIATNAADSPNAVSAQGTIGTNLNATISSRMASYSQPAGFLTTTFSTTVGTSTYSGGLADANIAAVKAKTDLIATNAADSPNTATAQGTIGTLGSSLAAITGKFTGITLLANWLRSLARSDTPDATALTEVNAGGGAFNPATQSLQALRARGDSGAWGGSGGGGGSGDFAMPILVTGDGTTPVLGASVRITQNQPNGPLITGSNGLATFALDTGIVEIACKANGFRGTVITSAIDSNGQWPGPVSTLVITLTALVPSGSAPAGQVYAMSTAFDIGVGSVPNVEIYYRLTQPPTGVAGVFPGETQTATSDDDGVFQIELWDNAEYEFWYGRGEKQSLTTDGVSPVNIPTLVGAQSANR